MTLMQIEERVDTINNGVKSDYAEERRKRVLCTGEKEWKES
jgi:hypothetical protein